jgi:hypothetical protein
MVNDTMANEELFGVIKALHARVEYRIDSVFQI